MPTKTEWFKEEYNRMKEEYDFLNQRITIPNFIDCNNKIDDTEYIKLVIDTIKSKLNIDLSQYETKITDRTNKDNFKLGYHIDGYRVDEFDKKRKISDTYKWRSISINPPVFSCLTYYSDFNIDFKGGTLEFIDGKIIKPQKGLFVFLNSKDIHRVNRLISGERKNKFLTFHTII